VLQAVLEHIPGLTDADFVAHALLAATRADLVEHLAGEERVSRERMRAQLANFASRVLAPGPMEGVITGG
jgi:sRNA-binding protein